jgi:flavin reductase (DIM6/NTAB) family NADH-FMN oxidoreductase RutF
MIQQTEFAEAYSQVHLPAKVALVVTERPIEGYNLITIEWFMRTSIQPPMFAISIAHSRFSHDCLEANRFFNLVYPSTELHPLCNLAGSNSGREMDKFKEGKVDWFPGKLHKLPILKESVVTLECEVITQVNSGDHTIYVGQVHYVWLDKDKELYYFEGKTKE